MRMMMCDLPQDLIEEVLSRAPITCGGRVRSTCKGWNVLFNDKSFTKKHCAKAAKELMAIMVYDSRPYLTCVNLQNHKDLVEPPIKETGNFSTSFEQICGVCYGLLLCIPKDNTKGLQVWNPYLGQVSWIQIHHFCSADWYAIGYDHKSNNHKILRICFNYDICLDLSVMHQTVDYEIYSFKSNSWKVLRDTLDWLLPCYSPQGVSVKGNTYFFAYDSSELSMEKSLVCFDFTRERSEPCLHLPFQSYSGHDTILSTVREEQLAVLFQGDAKDEIEIWITTTIEFNALSWRTFLKVDLKPPIGGFYFQGGTFLVDEKKKTTVLCCIDLKKQRDNKAYVIEEDGSYKVVDLGESQDWPKGCSYVPSSVQIQ